MFSLSLSLSLYLSLSLFNREQQQESVAANTSVSTGVSEATVKEVAGKPEEEAAEVGEGGGVQGPKGHNLIRRKSYLPTDYETAMALQHYNPVDNVLTTSKES